MRRYALLLLFVLALAALSPSAPAVAAPNAPPDATTYRYFTETGHAIKGDVKAFWDTHGSLEALGLPLTEVFTEDGISVQYFERARFEIKPEGIEMTRLGGMYTQGRTDEAFTWLADPANPDVTFFTESGHTLGGAFRYFWESRGGVKAFGFPISQELTEANPTTGVEYIVQYFERARFEYHPDLAGKQGEVQLGTLGRWLLEQKPELKQYTAPIAPEPLAPAHDGVLLGKATTSFRTSPSERVHNIARATAMFDGVVVPAGKEYSFASSGDFREDGGFVEGNAIVNGRLEKVIGGGLCQVSTTMFRAVSNAGLEITRRTGHTFVVNFYENILGFDATVFTPEVDFRFRNDMATPITMYTFYDVNSATLTFEIWGTSDGRTVSYQGPYVKNVVKPGAAIWQYDPKLPRGAVQQLVHGRSGMDVNYLRAVRMPNGSLKHNDNYYTHYQPWADQFLYGPGVKPRK